MAVPLVPVFSPIGSRVIMPKMKPLVVVTRSKMDRKAVYCGHRRKPSGKDRWYENGESGKRHDKYK